MSNAKRHKRRARRRKLTAHDRGENRHNKVLAHMLKQRRLRDERNEAKLKPRAKP